MTTRKQLQEWLNRFPEDTIIEVGIQQKTGNYESYGSLDFISPELIDSDTGDGWEFMDFRKSTLTKETNVNFNKTFLRLGEPN